MLFNYYVNDHVFLAIKGGFPAKVTAKGIGQVNAPVTGEVNLPATSAELVGTSHIPISQQIPVNDIHTGKNLISGRTKIDVDPIITYVGIGYRF